MIINVEKLKWAYSFMKIKSGNLWLWRESFYSRWEKNKIRNNKGKE